MVNIIDIENIVKENDIQVSAVHSMCRIYTKGNCDGSVFVVPGLFLSVLLIIGIGQPLHWSTDHQDCPPDEEYIDITVWDRTYTDEHSGGAIGFFGFGTNSMNIVPTVALWLVFELNVFALLVFVN